MTTPTPRTKAATQTITIGESDVGNTYEFVVVADCAKIETELIELRKIADDLANFIALEERCWQASGKPNVAKDYNDALKPYTTYFKERKP